MVQRSHLSVATYGGVILLWIALIVGMLYLPHLIESLREEKRVIRIMTFGGIIDPAYVRKFEQQTGIKVIWSYYSSNEELQAKLKKTGAKGMILLFLQIIRCLFYEILIF